MTYKILRNYADDDIDQETIKSGLTLEEAKEHCKNVETSSKTCTKAAGVNRTRKCGPWFDSWTEE